MPGILPMKVIKVGTNAQTRIAQACDRCRSKKIRCDGIRPSCTQCVNVGFECKTSDKLSRRAFPRGYTESLEERVRSLELEVRELKDLLDEKDEKIDLLSRIHSHSPHSPHSVGVPRTSSSQSPVASIENKDEPVDKEDVFKVQQSPLLLDDENCDSYFVGTSSGRALVDAFKRKVQETGKPCGDIHPEMFFHPGPKASAPSHNQQGRIVSFKPPPRLVSDQLINIFLQEWAPLFPVLHRPSFLHLYENYVANPEGMDDKKSLAQLNLIFYIAALSSESRSSQDVESFEAQWHASTETFLMDNSLPALQCFILAQISCLLSADYPRLMKYKGLAISLSHRLGLHQSQKRFALGALTAETRKKVFWSLYVVDCFSAAQLGVPRMLREDDVHCEYPVDADDEYITEKGFMPTLPGESTKLSSALALFRVSRILGKVLSEMYPASANTELSFRSLNMLVEELESWSDNLAPHLRLQFVQDKPSTNVISSRSPILSMVYHYTKALIYRPAVCANLVARGSSATLALASSSKSIVQIIQLLDERKLSFSLSLNRNELLLLCGFSLLFQTLNAEQEGKLYKDSEKMVCAVIDILERSGTPTASTFRLVGFQMLSPQRTEKNPASPPLSRHSSEGSMPAPQETAFRATQKHLKAIAQCFSPSMSKLNRVENSKDQRRSTAPNLHPSFLAHGNQSAASISSIRSESSIPRSEASTSPLSQRLSLTPRSKRPNINRRTPNLDYLAFDASAIPGAFQQLHLSSSNGVKTEVSAADWERLLGSLDNGQTNIYDGIYGGPPVDALIDVPPSASSESQIAWSPDMWNFPPNYGSTEQLNHIAASAQSVLSFSDESFTSGEEFPVDFPSVGSDNTADRSYPGLVMPEMSPLGGIDGAFRL